VKLSLSTNWCSHAVTNGEEISEKAVDLGFNELELGYAATDIHIQGIRRKLDLIPVGSVHAFCPVPISAPLGHPELYRLADFNPENRALANTYVKRSVQFAADIGADTVVLHAGKISINGLFDRLDSQKLKCILNSCGGNCASRRYMKTLSLANSRRWKRGRKMIDIFSRTLEDLIPTLEKHSVILAFENMPYLEGFPNEDESELIIKRFASAPVKSWLDTGHHLVRVNHGWTSGRLPFSADNVAGMHLNDVENLHDDHLAPGEGNVDFASFENLARNVRHVVFEPSSSVGEESLRRALSFIRKSWKLN
jgi:sugar phosphate isomerase/epimerase